MLQRLARQLGALCLICAMGSAHAEPVADVLHLDVPETIGGLSALEITDDGTTAYMLSDRGTLFRAEIQRDAQGRATDVVFGQSLRLLHDGEHRHPDSEGLAIGPKGAIYVSAEDPTRLLRYRWGDKTPDYFPDLPTTRELTGNRGFEALAFGPSGGLFTMFETDDDGAFPLYRFAQGAWEVLPALPATPDFSVVGADFGPEGALYVLERAFSGLGFRTHLRRVTLGETAHRSETVFRTVLGAYDNFEGVSVWQTAAGETRVSLISDDNFLSILQTTLLEFSLSD